MDGLRWLLLLFGVLVVVGVYVYSRRQQNAGAESPPLGERREPTLGRGESVPGKAAPAPEVADADTDDDQAAEPDDEPSRDESRRAPTQPQKIVTLRLVARNRGAFPGDELILSLRGIGMRHGRFGIYHRIDGEDDDRTIFSAASLVEPGSFDLTNLKEQRIPGISLFMVLPGPVDGAQAFDLMMVAARALAQSLNAELLDESGSTLSIQRERYLREEIIEFEHGIKVA